MITPAHVQMMARYNRWQNRSLYGAADRLPDVERKRARGAFFESIHGTLSHLVFADQIWMHRFTKTTELPLAKTIAQSATAMPDWDKLKSTRVETDEVILAWADQLTPKSLEGDLAWHAASIGQNMSKPLWMLVTHLFNHQTHHRGQVHCLLTQNGLKLEPTDIPFMS
jgi:uncharacterized damage-inducible protein DinB